MVAQLIIKAALVAAQTALSMTRKIEGPRVNDLKVTLGDYGAPWPRVWGTKWLRPPVIWAKDLVEVKRRRKTKGGKYNDYTYFGSWAVGLACHELAGVRRIKLDGHLVYDTSGAGPVTPFDFSGTASSGKGGHGGGVITDYLAFYPGTMTQAVDPKIQEHVEALHGEGSCPAYLGRSYLRIADLPLEKFGNRIPQIEVEVVSLLSTHIPSETFTPTYDPTNYWNLRFSSDYSRVAWLAGSTGTPGEPGGFEIWDVAARAPMLALPLEHPTTSSGAFGVFNDGTILFIENGDSHKVKTIDPSTGAVAVFYSGSGSQDGAAVLADGNGVEHWGTYPFSLNTLWYFDGLEYSPGWQANLFFRDAYGNIWTVGRTAPAGATVCHFLRLVEVDNTPGYLASFSLTLPAAGASLADATFAAASGDDFILRWNGVHYLVDPTDGTVITSVAASSAGVSTGKKTAWTNVVPGSGRIWLGNNEYDLLTGALIRTVSGVPASGGGYLSVYDPINHALWTSKDGLTIYYLDRLDEAAVTLGDVVADTCTVAGMAAAEIDVSALTQEIPGYLVTGGSGKEWLEPLFDLYDVDPRPHGFLLEFLPRGGAAGAELSSGAFADTSDQPLFEQTVGGGSDLPMQVTLQFADVATEQQPNTAMSPPLFEAASQRTQTVDMSTLALSADTARQLVARYARRQRFEAKPVTLALSAREIALEPGDVRPLDLRGVAVTARAHSLVLGADRRITCEWRRDDPSVALLDGSEGAPADGHRAATVAVPLLSKGFVLDVPLLADADASDNPLLYAGAAPFGPGTWPGATIYRSIDGEYSDEFDSVPSSAPLTWGRVSELLPASNPNLWDRLSSITVTLQTGTLAGASEAAVDANARLNLAAIGAAGRWELVQFTGVTLTAPNTYTVSGFKRGRRGSEWAAELHAAGDAFVLLDNVDAVALGLSDVGTDLSFKAITSGRTEGGAFPIDLAPFAGASLKPYAPCHLAAAKDPATGDWTLAWVRRTRVGGAWTSGTTIPLGEASEEYQLTVGDGVSSDTKTVSGSTTYTWTVAEQTIDTGGEVMAGDLAWSVAQVSDSVGAGYRAEAAA